MTDNDRNTPSVVIEARDHGGRDVVDVRVSIDRELVALTLSGHALPVDPGVHRFRFEYRKFPAIEQQVVIREGEKDRKIAIQFADPASAHAPEPPPAPVPAPEPAAPPTVAPAAPAPEPETPSAPSPWLHEPVGVYVLGGVGLVSLASFAYFGLSGLSQRGDLENCKPNCGLDDVQSAHNKLVVADISWIAGAAALGGAFLIHLGNHKDETSVAWYAAPSPTGAQAGVTIHY
jgi:hypothetical protein